MARRSPNANDQDPCGVSPSTEAAEIQDEVLSAWIGVASAELEWINAQDWLSPAQRLELLSLLRVSGSRRPTYVARASQLYGRLKRKLQAEKEDAAAIEAERQRFLTRPPVF